MKFGINAYNLDVNAGGVANYALTLLRHWHDFFPDDEIVIYAFEQNRPMLDTLGVRSGRRNVFLRIQEEIAHSWRELDVYFCPLGSYWPRPAPVPAVVSLMDVQERFFPENFTQEDMANRLFHYGESLYLADRVVAISDFTKESFRRMLGVREDKIDRIYLCPDVLPKAAAPPDSFPAAGFEKFAYYPANNWTHKNHIRLLDALQLLKEENKAIPTVFSGSLQSGGVDLAHEIELRGLSESCRHAGMVSRKEVSWLYRNAKLLVYPSLFEGFGIPLVEARQVNLPALHSNQTSLQELSREDDILCDPYSVESIKSSLATAWDHWRHKERPKAMEDARLEFTPERLVREHRDCLAKAIEQYSASRTRRRHLWSRLKFLRRRRKLSARECKIAQEMLGR